MELKNIKRGLFGFKASGVLEYVSELNRICSEKVEEERREKQTSLDTLNQKNEELNNRLSGLESENDKLKKQLAEQEEKLAELSAQNEELKSNTNAQKAVEAEVADILTDARHFAQSLREKAMKENEDFRLENQKNNEAEQQRLAAYAKEVSEIKTAIDSVLTEAKLGLEKAEEAMAVLKKENG